MLKITIQTTARNPLRNSNPKPLLWQPGRNSQNTAKSPETTSKTQNYNGAISLDKNPKTAKENKKTARRGKNILGGQNKIKSTFEK